MDKSHEQAQETRKRNQRERMVAFTRKAERVEELQSFLKDIAANADATTAERLEAVKLIMELEHR